MTTIYVRVPNIYSIFFIKPNLGKINGLGSSSGKLES